MSPYQKEPIPYFSDQFRLEYNNLGMCTYASLPGWDCNKNIVGEKMIIDRIRHLALHMCFSNRANKNYLIHIYQIVMDCSPKKGLSKNAGIGEGTVMYQIKKSFVHNVGE